MNKFKGLNVTLLVSQIEDAKRISSALRKFSVIPHIFSDLEEFFSHTENEKIDLAIVDVMNMSKGNFIIKDHPRIVNGDLPVAFYYDDDSVALSSSTFSLPNCGIFNIFSETIDSELNSILEKAVKKFELEMKNRKLLGEITKNRHQLGKMIKTTESIQIKENHYHQLKTITRLLEEKIQAQDFYDACFDVFDSWEAVEEFGFYEMTPSTHKLVSPKSNHRKYKSLPSVWLGQEGNTGIENYGQSLGYHVALDYIGSNIVPVLLRGEDYNNPKAIFYLRCDEDFIENFDWVVFQSLLSGYYVRHILMNKKYEIAQGQLLSSWEFLTDLENYRLQGPAHIRKVVAIDFTNLVDSISDGGLSFYWKNFIDQMIAGIRMQVSEDFKMAGLGVHSLMLSCHPQEADNIFKKVKKHVESFSYWRFFEDPDIILGEILKPDVEFLNGHVTEVLNFVENGKSIQYDRDGVSYPRARLNSEI